MPVYEKLSQLGIVISSEIAEANLRRLLEVAREHGCEVEVDMEHTSVGRETLAIFRRVQPDFPKTRVAVRTSTPSATARRASAWSRERSTRPSTPPSATRPT